MKIKADIRKGHLGNLSWSQRIFCVSIYLIAFALSRRKGRTWFIETRHKWCLSSVTVSHIAWLLLCYKFGKKKIHTCTHTHTHTHTHTYICWKVYNLLDSESKL